MDRVVQRMKTRPRKTEDQSASMLGLVKMKASQHKGPIHKGLVRRYDGPYRIIAKLGETS